MTMFRRLSTTRSGITGATARGLSILVFVGLSTLAVSCSEVSEASSFPEPDRATDLFEITRPNREITTLRAVDERSILVEATDARSTGSNARSVFAWNNAMAGSSQWSCATVRHEGGGTQEGVALRIRTDDARVRAITVTKNIMFGATWVYNVHLWDTARRGAVPATLLTSVDLRRRFGPVDSVDTPRRLCAAVEGNELRFKAWRASRPEPDWNDSTSTETVILPKAANFEGVPGWYIGHLPDGALATYEDVIVGYDTAWRRQSTTSTTAPGPTLPVPALSNPLEPFGGRPA
ncbi:MAG: hypothetical protein M9952_02425 [Microthrixaceae bacterium]|nr:hypothetical protein [Microthrixaceae bacterium]MCO5311775.1 hypothetical protein [Microthrixaceae bacterium]